MKMKRFVFLPLQGHVRCCCDHRGAQHVIESVPRTRVFQRVRAIDKKDSIRTIVFLADLDRKYQCKNVVCCRYKLNIQQIVYYWNNGSVQPILVIIELNRGFVNTNMIRTATARWLKIYFMNPIMNG